MNGDFPPTAYHVIAEPQFGIWLSKPGTWKGFRGVVMFGLDRAASTDAIYQTERAAKIQAGKIRARYQAELEATGKRPEVARREAYHAKQKLREESKERRKGVMADRYEMVRLLNAIAIEENKLIGGALKRKAREMADKHAQALADYEADPANDRGGLPDPQKGR